jgi:hypothetical protein
MSEVVPNSRQEFWLRPAVAQALTAAPVALGEASLKSCIRCGTEFMTGSRFCYQCGAHRELHTGGKPAIWTRLLESLHVLGFHQVRVTLGLSIPSLLAFLAGIGCVVAAVRAGSVFGIHNFATFQGIQLLRIEWLLGSIAAFLAAILVKDAGSHK